MTFHFTPKALLKSVGAVAASAVLTVGLPNAAHAADHQSASASVTNGTLNVTGTNHADHIALRLAPGAPGILQVDTNDDGVADFSFDRSTFNLIFVQAGNGDDRVRVDQINGAFTDEAVLVDGGNGNDTFIGGDGNDVFVGGNGNDFADGNKGADTALLGSGNDTFQWDPGDGSDVVEGEKGNDTLVFNGANIAENMKLVANGRRALFLRDVGNITMDLAGIERVDTKALGGADLFTVGDLSGTDVKEANIDLAGPGGGGDGAHDSVTVTGTTKGDDVQVRHEGSGVDVKGLPTHVRITGNETTDHLQVNTGAGNDRVSVDRDAATAIDVGVDLGTDQVR